MFITSDNRPVSSNGILHFPDTSIRLSTSKNLYLISDAKLSSLNASLVINDEYSKDFKLYELSKLSYDIEVSTTGQPVIAGPIIVNGHNLALDANATAEDIAQVLYDEMQNSGFYYSVALNSTTITAIPLQSGTNIDNELATNTFESNEAIFVTTVEQPDDIIQIVAAQTLANTDYFSRNGKHVYKFNMLFEPQPDSGLHDRNYSFLHDAKLVIDYNDGEVKQFSSKLTGRSVELDGSLVVALQNFKKFITEDYYQAFADSSLNTNAQDEVLLNRKRREYLLVLFEMSGFVGAYKSLLTAIEYFGWGELLTIKEYWKSRYNDTYKLTDVKNQVLDKIEKQLAEYKKTNQMSLTYKVNTATGLYDEDGLPIYVNVLTDTDTVITKLYALKRVLELDFLTTNTTIIDITGEISAVVGAELNAWLNNAAITNVRLNENMHSNIEFNVKDDTVFIEEHQILTYPFAFEVLDDTVGAEKLEFVTPTPLLATNTATYFDVLTVLNEESGQTDFDYATKYYRGDFGLIELDVTEIDTDLYQSFRYLLYDYNTEVELFRSFQKPISELSSGIKVGVHSLGEFRLVVALFDNYGGMSIVGIPTKIEISNKPINFYIAKHDIEGKYKDLRLRSTMQDLDPDSIDKSYVVDTISETLDVNTYNQLTNVPTMTILKNYATIFDMHSTYTQARQLNSLPIEYLNKIPVEVWGYKYGTLVVDLVGSGIDGTREFGLKSFENHAFDLISEHYDSTIYATPELFLQKIITDLNNKPEDSFYRKFTYDINYYSNVPEALLTDARPMLRIKAIDQSLTINKFFIYEPNEAFAHADFPTSIDASDVMVFSIIDTMNVIHHNGQTLQGTFKLKLGENELLLNNVTFADIDEVEDTIKAWAVDNELTTISMWRRDGALIISCQEDFYVKHAQIGTHKDVFRGNTGTKIIRIDDGDDIKLAEPVYAFLDDDSKLNSANVKWTLTNALTDALVTTQYAQAFRYIITKTGSYTLTCESTDAYGTTITSKQGVYLVLNSLL